MLLKYIVTLQQCIGATVFCYNIPVLTRFLNYTGFVLLKLFFTEQTSTKLQNLL